MAGINGGWVVSPGQNSARYQDTGQGASGRIASWMAWGADPQPLIVAEGTNILRTDDNMGIGLRVPLGQGGCGEWRPVLQGVTSPTGSGAISGGDGCFFVNT